MNLTKVVKAINEQLKALSADKVAAAAEDVEKLAGRLCDLLDRSQKLMSVVLEGKEALHTQIPDVLHDTRATLRELEQRVASLEKKGSNCGGRVSVSESDGAEGAQTRDSCCHQELQGRGKGQVG